MISTKQDADLIRISFFKNRIGSDSKNPLSDISGRHNAALLWANQGKNRTDDHQHNSNCYYPFDQVHSFIAATNSTLYITFHNIVLTFFATFGSIFGQGSDVASKVRWGAFTNVL